MNCCDHECDVCLQFSNLSDLTNPTDPTNLSNTTNLENDNIHENWLVIKNKNITFTDREYEYACIQSVLALRWIPKSRQTERMLMCAFIKRFPHLYNNQTGTSTDDDINYDPSIYKYPISSSIREDLLTQKMLNYIESNGYKNIIHSKKTITKKNLSETIKSSSDLIKFIKKK